MKPQTLVETFDQANFNSIPSICSSHNLLSYPVSTCTVDHQLKRYEETAHSFTKDHDRLEIELSCNSVYELKDVIDIDGIITEFICLKGTHLSLCL